MGMRKVSDWDYRKIKESQFESNRLGNYIVDDKIKMRLANVLYRHIWLYMDMAERLGTQGCKERR
jgi:hypothetical protein